MKKQFKISVRAILIHIINTYQYVPQVHIVISKLQTDHA